MWLLLTAFVAWFVSQLVKFSIKGFHGQPDFKLFYQSGGMPSAHAATVTALSLAALTTEGWSSPIFGIATVFAAVVIYDTLGVRRASGEQSIMINAISKMVGNTKPVREVLGHTPREVAVGMLIGVFVGLAFTYTAWVDKASWLTEAPDSIERWIYLGIFSVLTILSGVARGWLQRLRQVAVVQTLKGAFGWAMALPGLLGLFFTLMQFEGFGAVTWRLWPLIILASFALAQSVLALELYSKAKSKYKAESAELLNKRSRKKKRRKSRKK